MKVGVKPQIVPAPLLISSLRLVLPQAKLVEHENCDDWSQQDTEDVDDQRRVGLRFIVSKQVWVTAVDCALDAIAKARQPSGAWRN